MAKHRIALGLEAVGGELRVAAVEYGDGGIVPRAAFTVEAGEDLARVVRERHLRPSASTVAVSLEGAAVRLLDLPPTTEENVERVVTLEAEGALPLPPEELALDYHNLGLTEQSRTEVLVAAARQSVVQDALRRVSMLPGATAAVTLTPVALLNALEHLQPQREAVCAVLRVEANACELLVTQRLRLIATQTLNGGWAAASEEHGVEPVSALAQQVRYSLRALAYERGASAERLWVCGSGAAHAALLAQLAAELELEVRPLAPEVPPGGEAAEHWAVHAAALGCAVQAAGAAAIALNLTPARMAAALEVAQRRESRVSAAALGVAGGLALLLVFAALVGGRRQALQQAREKLLEVGMVPSVKTPPADALERSASAVEESLKTPITAAGALALLGRALPPGAWLAELNYNAETGLVLRGYATTPAGPQQAHLALLDEPRFDAVTFDYRTQEFIGTQSVWSFQVTCRFPQRDTRTRRARGVATGARP